jgi:hypothetical protein
MTITTRYTKNRTVPPEDDDLRRHCCIERARFFPAGRETSDGRFVQLGFGGSVRFVHSISLTGSLLRVPFASNATVPAAGPEHK